MFRLLALMCLSASVLHLTGAVCKDPETGKEYKTGEQWTPPGTCISQTCHAEGDFSALGCPLSRPREGYHMSEENYKLPYPDCCPQEVKDDRK